MSDRDEAIETLADAAVELWEKAADAHPLNSGDTFTATVALPAAVLDGDATGVLIDAIQRKGRFTVARTTGASSLTLTRTNMSGELRGRGTLVAGQLNVTLDDAVLVASGTVTEMSPAEDDVEDM